MNNTPEMIVGERVKLRWGGRKTTGTIVEIIDIDHPVKINRTIIESGAKVRWDDGELGYMRQNDLEKETK